MQTKKITSYISPREVFFWVLIVIAVVLRVCFSLVDFPDNERVRVTDVVRSEPLYFDKVQMLRVAGMIVYVPRFPEVNYGDTVVIEGVVVDGKISRADLIRVVPTDKALYRLRASLMRVFQKSLPEPHASLIAGLVLGAKSSIPEDFKESLRYTGTLHVVVASGMNVTLVARFLLSVLLLVVARRRAVFFAVAGVWCYAVITGFDAPIIRAAIMGTLAFGAQAFGRLYSAWRALFLSALGMLIVSPEWIWDIGFILSFSATASLMLFEARINRALRLIPRLLREGLSTSLAAQILVAPILYATFGQFQPLSPLINALVLWVVAPATILGFTGALAGLLWLPLGRLILLLAYPFSWWFIQVTALFR